MITQGHRKALKNIGKYRTEAEALVKSGYSPSYARSGLIKRTDGWNDLVEKNLDKQKLLTVLNKGLDATKPIPDGEGFWPDYQAQHKFMESGIKIIGGFAPEKHQNVNVNIEAQLPKKKIEEIDKLMLDDE